MPSEPQDSMNPDEYTMDDMRATNRRIDALCGKAEPLAVTVGAVDCMERFGGSFAKAIAHAWQRADPDNRARLAAAFPELFKRYADIARETT